MIALTHVASTTTLGAHRRRRLVSGLVLALLAAGCDCGGSNIGQATNGVTLLDPAGPPDQFERVVDFGTVRVAKLASKKLVFRNDGRTSARVTSARLVTSSPDFYLAGATPLPTIEPKATWELELRYLPSDIGEDQADVIVETDVADTAKYTVHVTGKGASSQIDVCSTDDAGAEICFSKTTGGTFVVNVGEARPGDTKRKPLVVKNLGDAAMTVTRVATTDATTPEYTMEPKAGVAARADGSFDVVIGTDATYDVVYQPLDGGDDDGFVEVLSDDPNNPRILVQLHATGLAPRLCVTPVPVDFGDQALGVTGHQKLTLSSCGREAVTIDALVFVNPGSSTVFDINAPPTLPLSLAAGDKVELDLTYRPIAFRDDDGQLTLRFTDTAPSIGRIPLHGRGVGCTLRAVPSSVNFGQVSTGGRTSKTVQVRNEGTGDCTISEIHPPTAPYALDRAPPPPVVVPPGQATTLVVSYAPSGQGTQTDKVELLSGGGLLTIPLTGSGIAPPPCDLQAQPTSLVFTGISTGQSATQNVLLKNFGSAECSIVSGGILPSSSPAFTATAGGFPPPTVPSGGQISVPVKFAPTTAGVATGTLQVVYNDTGTPCFPGLPCSGKKLDIALEGGTLAPAICISPADLDYGQVAAGTLKTLSFVVTSCGQGALGIRGITLAPGTSTDYTLTTPVRVPQFLAPNQTLTVNVTYSPRTSGADFGQVVVMNNDPAHARSIVRLRANAGSVCDRQLACSTDKIVFPTMEIGRASSMTVVCQNVGTQPTTVSAVGFSRATSPEFKASVGRTPHTVAPGDSIRVEVTYTPQDAGNDLGELDVQGDACTPATIALEASGKQPNYPRCIPPQTFQPVEKWSWSGGQASSPSKNVEMAPIVLNLNDDNGDGRIDESDIPDVIFTTCKSGECCLNCLNPQDMKNMDFSGRGSLRAVNGKDGHDQWVVSDPALQLTGTTGLAAGDLDGDNIPEIVAVKYHFQAGSGGNGMEGKYKGGDLLVFDNTGKLKFETEAWVGDEHAIEQGSAPTIADLDGDGAVEILFERTVFHNDGTRWFDLPASGNDGHGSFPIVSDLDDDGSPEIILGKSVYNANGTLKWAAHAENGPTMVLDVDLDGKAEVILRDSPTSFRVYNADGTLKGGPFSWQGPAAGGICSSAIAAADLDGDHKPEIIIPSGDFIHAFKADGTQMWEQPIEDWDGQCGASGAAAFDFEGDQKYEVVYHDTKHMYVFRGTDGTKLFDAPRNSSTLFETPVVADVDNDGHADMVMTNENGVLGIGNGAGVKVWSNVGNNWPATRRVWNEHSYHQSNVHENGSVPRVEVPSWKANNNWRANPPLCR